MSLPLVLTPDEVAVLFRQDPATRDDGGFQGFLVRLQEKTNRATGEITLDDEDLERIPRYAFDYKQGGWEDRLKAIFGRGLGEGLGR